MKNDILESTEGRSYEKNQNAMAFSFCLPQDWILDRTGMNVFIGKNASGKTTVLEAVSVMLGAYLAAFKEYVPSRFVQNISDMDVHKK